MEKAKARSERKEAIKALTIEERARKSAIIAQAILNLPEISPSKVIMAYAPLDDEVSLCGLWQGLIDAGKTLVFPVLMRALGHMEAVAVGDIQHDLGPGRFGVMQPFEGRPVDPASIDLVFVPALAYDRHGHRLGRGGGYYDRFLTGRAVNAFRCGVAFSCQLVECVPTREHDCAVHAVVTEEGILRIDGN